MRIITPDFYNQSLAEIDWQKIPALGIELLFLDIDNTLAADGSRQADHATINLLREMEKAGLSLCVLSNAKAERGAEFTKNLGIPYLGLAMKPLTFKIKSYLRQQGLKPARCLMVGDQLFTDVMAGRRSGCKTLLVPPLAEDLSSFVRWKRKLENYFFLHGLDLHDIPSLPKCKRLQ